MLKIELVNLNGRLVGRRFQDRWNLQALGIDSLAADRNQTALKALRRKKTEDGSLFLDGFSLSVMRNGEYQEVTPEDMDMLGDAYRAEAA